MINSIKLPLLLFVLLLVAPALWAQDRVLSTFDNDDKGLIDITTDRDNSLFIIQPGIRSNPKTDGVNETAQCFGMKMQANAGWWRNWTQWEVAQPILITEESRYLKMMVYRSSNNGNVRMQINGVETDIFFVTNEVNRWEDIVIDLYRYKGSELTKIFINHHDWNGQSGPISEYYFDELVLSNTPTPRGVTALDAAQFAWRFSADGKLTNDYIASVAPTHSKTTLAVVQDGDAQVLQIDRPSDTGYTRSGVEVNFAQPLNLLDATRKKFLIRAKATTIPEDELYLQVEATDYAGYKVYKTIVFHEADVWKDCLLDFSMEISYLAQLNFRFGVRRSSTGEAWLYSTAGQFFIESMTLVD